MSDEVTKSINFVWGNVGKDLQKLDKERMLAIAQQNPEKHLAIRSNLELFDLLDMLEKEVSKLDGSLEIPENIFKKILEINKSDNVFREVAKFLRYKSDMLSIGSTITGQIEKKSAFLKTNYGKDKDD